MCFGPDLLIVPNEHTKRVGDYFKAIIYLHYAFVIVIFLSARWIDGAIDALIATIGLMAIRNPEGYSARKALCYTIFVGFDSFWAIINVITFFSGVLDAAPSTQWMFYLYNFSIIFGVAFYLMATFIGYQLYKALKLQLEALVPEMMRAAQPPAPWGGVVVQPSNASAAPSAPAASTSSAPSTSAGFKAFSGTGYKLGGNWGFWLRDDREKWCKSVF